MDLRVSENMEESLEDFPKETLEQFLNEFLEEKKLICKHLDTPSTITSNNSTTTHYITMTPFIAGACVQDR